MPGRSGPTGRPRADDSGSILRRFTRLDIHDFAKDNALFAPVLPTSLCVVVIRVCPHRRHENEQSKARCKQSIHQVTRLHYRIDTPSLRLRPKAIHDSRITGDEQAIGGHGGRGHERAAGFILPHLFARDPIEPVDPPIHRAEKHAVAGDDRRRIGLAVCGKRPQHLAGILRVERARTCLSWLA